MPTDEELAHRVARDEDAARAAITGRMLKVLAGAVAMTVLLASFEPSNDVRITLAVQGSALAFVVLGAWLHHRGRSRAAGWSISAMFWLVVCVSTWVFGGLKYELGTAYIVSVMVAGATLGGRAAIGFAVLSIVASATVLWAELGGWLPPPIEPPSVINAWIGLTVSLLLASYLLNLSLTGLHEAVTRAYRLAFEKEEVRDRFLQAQKMEPVGRLAGGVAHDFNNLLSVVNGVAALLRPEVEGSPSAQVLLDDLDAAATRMAQMTGQLLAFSRARAPADEVLDMCEVLRALTPLLSRLMGDDVEVILDASDEPCFVRGDRARVEQVFLNLAVNAREAMPEGGTLRFEVRGTAQDGRRWVCVAVTDTGHGIDEATLGTIFEPFFTTKPTGTGLGLATVHDVVDGFGGTVRVESAVGQGTTFRIELPRVDATLTRPLAEPLVTFSRAGGRILLVEDHALVRQTTRRALELEGYDVTTVHDGAEALALVASGARFDLVVTDVMMPRMTGIELTRRLVSEGHRIPIVLVSGNVAGPPDEITELPVYVAFLPKPFVHEQLLATVREGLARGTPPRAADMGGR